MLFPNESIPPFTDGGGADMLSAILEREIVGVRAYRRTSFFKYKNSKTIFQPLSTFFPALGSKHNVVLLGLMNGKLISIDINQEALCVFKLNENETESKGHFVKIDESTAPYTLLHSNNNGIPLSACRVECVVLGDLTASLVITPTTTDGDCSYSELRIFEREFLLHRVILSSLQNKLSVFPPLAAFKSRRNSLVVCVVDGGTLKFSICRNKSSREEKVPTQGHQFFESCFEFKCDDKAPWYSLKESEEKNEQKDNKTSTINSASAIAQAAISAIKRQEEKSDVFKNMFGK